MTADASDPFEEPRDLTEEDAFVAESDAGAESAPAEAVLSEDTSLSEDESLAEGEAIAEELGISVAAAKVRLHRARKRLRDVLFEERGGVARAV